MRFHLGSIPETPEFTPDASWRAIREPTPWVMRALALPIGVAAAAIVMVLWLTVTPLEKLTGTLSVSLIVILFAGIVVTSRPAHHECQGDGERVEESLLNQCHDKHRERPTEDHERGGSIA